MLVGRALLSVIFIVAGISKIGAFTATAAYVATVLPFSELVTALTIILEIGGGLLLLLGYRTQSVAVALGVFTLLAAFLFHFDLADQVQSGQFMKNLAMAGGFLYVAVFGAGAYSIDGRKKSTAPSPVSS